MGDAMKRSDRRAQLSKGIIDVLRGTIDHLAFFHSAIADRVGLNTTDYLCLQLLLRQGPQTAGELAEQVGITSGAVTGLLDRLERTGYAVRTQDPEDRRSVIVSPVRGKVLAAIEPLFESFFRELKRTLTRYNVSQLADLVEFLASVDELFEQETTEIRMGLNRPWRGPLPEAN